MHTHATRIPLRISHDAWRGASRSRRERGITLVVSLVFLLLLTILGVTSMTTGTLQGEMAGNMRDLDIGMQSAEASLRYGEEFFARTFAAATEQPETLGALNTLWPANTVMPAQIDDPAWWTANGISYMNDGSKQLSEAYEDPRHVIEKIEERPVPELPKTTRTEVYYRITARGVGGTGMSQTVLQSHYRVNW